MKKRRESVWITAVLAIAACICVVWFLARKPGQSIEATNADSIVEAIVGRTHTDAAIEKAIVDFGSVDGYGASSDMTFVSACVFNSPYRAELLRWLIANGVELNPKHGEPPLLYAVVKDDADTAIKLLRSGASWHHPTRSGKPVFEELRFSTGVAKIREKDVAIVPPDK